MAAAPLRVLAGDGAILIEDARDGGSGGRVVLRNAGNGVSIEQCSADGPLPFAAKRTDPAHAVAGVIQLAQGPYAVLITESTVLGRGPYGATVHRAERWDLVALFSRTSSETMRRAEEEYLRLFESVSSTRTFYYSWDLDLTHTTQHALRAGAEWQALPRWRRAHPEFTWNYHMLSPFAHCDVSAQVLAPFVVPVVNGHVEIHDQCAIRDVPFALVFVSRRSRFRQGTRFHRRGINAQGHVANFVETEQMVVRRDGRVTAFTQLRGSIPLFWDQPCTLKYAPRVVLTDHGSRVTAAFRAHVKRFIDHWGAMVAVNLIDKKKDQKVLGDAFEREVVRFGDPDLRYVWFDFHHECRKMQWHNLAKLLDAVRADVDRFGYFEADARGRVLRTQQGILRTNCMDNLDRTNVVQSIFARYSLLSQLQAHQPAEDPLESGHAAFENVFKHVWANNADAMSVLYSGTGALKVHRGPASPTGPSQRGALTSPAARADRLHADGPSHQERRPPGRPQFPPPLRPQ